MARPLSRIEFPGAVYHVTARGNAQQSLFELDAERAAAYRALERFVADCRWLCHAYCFMANHYHLLLETPAPGLAYGMRQLNSLYAQWFNRSRDRVGHVFQGRYHAVLVEREAHLLELCRYVVLNPARAGASEGPDVGEASSYAATAGLREAPSFLETDWILGQFSYDRARAEARYRSFVADELVRNPWRDLRGQIYLGSEEFARRHSPRGARVREIPRMQWRPTRPVIAELYARHGDRAVLVAVRDCGYRLGEVATYLGVHVSTVGRRLRALEADGALLQDLTPGRERAAAGEYAADLRERKT